MGETGADPEPTSTRTMAKVDPHTAMSSTSARSAISTHEVEADRQHRVDGDEESPFQPVRLAVERNDAGGEHRQGDGDGLEAGEGEVHRRAQREAGEDEDGRDEERDLLGGLPG